MTLLDLDRVALEIGDCREALARFRPSAFDSCVTDPPYELGFMNKKWDGSGVAFEAATWAFVFRTLKPGGHLLAFGAPRTYHRMACAIEDAGFEIRDSLQWIYGTGFPKSLTNNTGMPEGQGTALKPGHEPIILARRPLVGTVAENVAAYGTGGLQIDACRIEGRERADYGLATATRSQGVAYSAPSTSADFDSSKGRWPANVLLDVDAAGELGEPARFFYTAKASRPERDLGCESLPMQTGGAATDRVEGSAGMANPRAGAGRTGGARNFHPTVKPIALMRYLVRLVTPPGGVCLDPFTGSGSTGVAAVLEGRGFVGIEKEEGYGQIAKLRIERALK